MLETTSYSEGMNFALVQEGAWFAEGGESGVRPAGRLAGVPLQRASQTPAAPKLQVSAPRIRLCPSPQHLARKLTTTDPFKLGLDWDSLFIYLLIYLSIFT